MATKLKNMKLTSVDLVRAGANQEADICLFKSAEPPAGAEPPLEDEKNIFKRFLDWVRKNAAEAENGPHNRNENQRESTESLEDLYKSALEQSLDSIQKDDSLTDSEKESMSELSREQYNRKLKELHDIEEKEDRMEREIDDDRHEDPESETEDELTGEIDDPDDDDRYDEIDEIPFHKRYDTIEDVTKFNPYHDSRGRFSDGNSIGSFAPIRGKTPNGQRLLQQYKERHKDDIPASPPSTVGTRPRTGLASGLGEDHAKKIEALIAKAPEENRQLWDKYGDEVKVGDANSRRSCYKPGSDQIYVNINKDSSGQDGLPEYEVTFHESGHAIDAAIGRKIGAKHFSTDYNNGEFQKTLEREADSYIKAHQQKMQQERGGKVPIQTARDDLAMNLRIKGYADAGDVSDMLEGATKGKFHDGAGGHGKSYWTDQKLYGTWTIPGHKVATEAFAEMFSATTTNPRSAALIKEVFPESYNVFQTMIKEAATYE